MIEFIDKNYRNFLIVFSAACLAIVAISYLEAGHFNSDFAGLELEPIELAKALLGEA